MSNTNEFCYWINPAQNFDLTDGFVPSVVKRNVSGHFPMTGNPEEFQAPWIWGKTLEAAEKIARQTNEKMGISVREEMDIIFSSMRAKQEKENG